jgi:hypothetical protein
VKVVESFKGRRVRHRAGPWRRIRSSAYLILVALVLGALLAAVLTAIVAGIALAIQHAAGS